MGDVIGRPLINSFEYGFPKNYCPNKYTKPGNLGNLHAISGDTRRQPIISPGHYIL